MDVKKNTLKDCGAVSEKDCQGDGENGAFITGSDVCVSITGIAGPDGGSEEKAGWTCVYGLLSEQPHYSKGVPSKGRQEQGEGVFRCKCAYPSA